MIPCAKVLSVAVFYAFLCLFPVGSGFILEVFSQRPGRPVPTFLNINVEHSLYVPGIRECQQCEDQAARDGNASPTVKRVSGVCPTVKRESRESKPNSETGTVRNVQ